MALILPAVFDTCIRLWDRYSHPASSTSGGLCHERLAKIIIDNASLIDVLRWRRVSGAFQKAAKERISSFTRIDVRIYDGLADMRNHKCDKDAFEWHPRGNVMLMETGPGQLGIAVDTRLKISDVKALLQVLTAFRLHVEELFIDSPIIELLVAQINKQQVNLLVEMLKSTRRFDDAHSQLSTDRAIANLSANNAIPGPFFPVLKKLTITSQSNQLEHLSRLVTYAVGVDFLYETQNIDLLCLKICIGGQWCRKRNVRMFRHVNRFRQWTEADTLGERYFQQFSGGSRKTSKSSTRK
uniref:F-box domain-containing protein n=1 Tax=Panagrellus redivivus TaxID=6233 RepID=A0A7E4VMG9_PANRE